MTPAAGVPGEEIVKGQWKMKDIYEMDDIEIVDAIKRLSPDQLTVVLDYIEYLKSIPGGASYMQPGEWIASHI